MRKQAGFTLGELMMAIAIAGVLLAVGVPQLRVFMQNGRITTVTNDLVASFNKARSEAIKNNSFTCVCPTTDANADAPACEDSGNWETGWIVFTDFEANCVINVNDVLLLVWDGSTYGNELTVRNDNASINATNKIIFNSRGEPRQSSGASQLGVFKICDERGIVASGDDSITASGVVLNAAGSVRATRSINQIGDECP